MEGSMTKSGMINRREPDGVAYFRTHPVCRELFQRNGWLTFCERLQGYNKRVTQAFAENFDGTKARVGDLELSVTEESIAVTAGLQQEGERWFKGMKTNKENWNEYLLSNHQNPDWSKGIPRSWIKEEWRDVLITVQKFITCEGRYSSTFLYQMRFLLHFQKTQKINLPFFLFRSLVKMSQQVQSYPVYSERKVFHHALLKLLILGELRNHGRTWEHFLLSNGFLDTSVTAGQSELLGIQRPLANNISPSVKKRRVLTDDEPTGKIADTMSRKKIKTQVLKEENVLAEKDSIHTPPWKRQKRKNVKKMTDNLAATCAPRLIVTRSKAREASQQLETEQNKGEIVITEIVQRRRRTRPSSGRLLSKIPVKVTSGMCKAVGDASAVSQHDFSESPFIGLEKEDSDSVKPTMHPEQSTPENAEDRAKLKKKEEEIQRLKEEIVETELLHRHLKRENENLKARNARLRAKKERLQSKCKLLFRKTRKWYKQIQLLKKSNMRFKYKLIEILLEVAEHF